MQYSCGLELQGSYIQGMSAIYSCGAARQYIAAEQLETKIQSCDAAIEGMSAVYSCRAARNKKLRRSYSRLETYKHAAQ